MKKVYHMITCINYLLAIYLVKRMVLKDETEIWTTYYRNQFVMNII